MIDNDESQETINMVIAEYERRNETDDESGKTTPTDQDTSVDVEQVSDMDLPSEDGSLDSPKVEEEKPEVVLNLVPEKEVFLAIFVTLFLKATCREKELTKE